jgi:hypothetical protein
MDLLGKLHAHHAEVVFNPNPMNQKSKTDFGYPRACRFRKTLKENRLCNGSFLYKLFSKRDFYHIKCGWNWQKMTKNWFFRKNLIFDYIRCKNVWDVFHDLKNVKIAQRSKKICQFWLYFMNLNHVLKKVGRGRSHNTFSLNVFLNLHALEFPKSVSIFWFIGFGLTLSMMCTCY